MKTMMNNIVLLCLGQLLMLAVGIKATKTTELLAAVNVFPSNTLVDGTTEVLDLKDSTLLASSNSLTTCPDGVTSCCEPLVKCTLKDTGVPSENPYQRPSYVCCSASFPISCGNRCIAPGYKCCNAAKSDFVREDLECPCSASDEKRCGPRCIRKDDVCCPQADNSSIRVCSSNNQQCCGGTCTFKSEMCCPHADGSTHSCMFEKFCCGNSCCPKIFSKCVKGKCVPKHLRVG